MEVADLALGPGDDLAVESSHDTKRPVSCRVGRPDVDDLGLELILVVGFGDPVGNKGFGLGQNPSFLGVVVLAQSVSLECLVGEDSAEIRVAVESYSHQIPGFAFKPIGRFPDSVGGRHPRIVLVDRDPDPDTVPLVEAGEVIDHLETLLVLRVVDATDIEQQVAVELRTIAECAQHLDHSAPVGGDLGETVGRGCDGQFLVTGKEFGQRVGGADFRL